MTTSLSPCARVTPSTTNASVAVAVRVAPTPSVPLSYVASRLAVVAALLANLTEIPWEALSTYAFVAACEESVGSAKLSITLKFTSMFWLAAIVKPSNVPTCVIFGCEAVSNSPVNLPLLE